MNLPAVVERVIPKRERARMKRVAEALGAFADLVKSVLDDEG